MARSPSGASSSHSPVKTHPSVLRHSKSSTFGSRNSGTSEATFSRTSFQGRRSGDTDASHGDSRSLLTSPTPFAGPPLANTLKSKLSLPALKMREIRNSERPSLQEERSPTLSVVSLDNDKARVQVKDVDFEMVKPNVQHLASIHEDTFGSPLPSPVRPDMASLRADSPAFSMISGVSSRQPSTPVKPESFPALPTDPTPPTQDPHEVEAHRQRELKWITMMSTIPASQARKNKKIRKLLWEGVPASVRYLVWAHLTDSKAKRIEGLYSKMVQRERVPAAANIERDLNKVFPNDRQLHDGCLLNVLQAYLSMVPDTHYNRGERSISTVLLRELMQEQGSPLSPGTCYSSPQKKMPSGRLCRSWTPIYGRTSPRARDKWRPTRSFSEKLSNQWTRRWLRSCSWRWTYLPRVCVGRGSPLYSLKLYRSNTRSACGISSSSKVSLLFTMPSLRANMCGQVYLSCSVLASPSSLVVSKLFCARRSATPSCTSCSTRPVPFFPLPLMLSLKLRLPSS